MKENFMANGFNSFFELFTSSLLYVSIDTNSFLYGPHLLGETTRYVITHLSTYFAIMRTPNSIKTDNGPAYILSSSNNFYIHSLLNRLQTFLVIHKQKT